MEHIILKHSLCYQIISDQGPEFIAGLSMELYRLLGIDKVRTTAYEPRTNGAIESWHKVLNSLIAKVVSENQKDWSRYISYVVFCYNASIHSATGFSPFFLMTGRQPLWNIDFLLHGTEETCQSIPEFTADVVERLDKAYALVREHLQQAADHASTWYNRKVKVKAFEVGDQVMVYNPRRFKGRTPKWQSFYKETAVVSNRLNDVTYVVNAKGWRKPRVIHIDKLKALHEFN
jgi:transposase InsO family protein